MITLEEHDVLVADAIRATRPRKEVMCCANDG